MRWLFRKKKKRKAPSAHYVAHKERARVFINERLEYFNAHYQLQYKRVFIKNQKSCWGSCSANANLNFNYKLVFLPPHLADYVIIHELCHLAELNHSPAFWAHVAKACPDFAQHRNELRRTFVRRGKVIQIGSTPG